MKKIILFSFLSLFVLSVYSQDDDQDDGSIESNFYIGIGAGIALPSGEEVDAISTGISLGLINLGYRFDETWGITANLNSMGFAYKDNDGTFGIGILSVGGSLSAPIGQNTILEFKPQYALNVAGKTRDVGLADEFTVTGTGFVLGNSLVFGSSKGIKFSINFDWMPLQWKEIEYGGVTVDADTVMTDDQRKDSYTSIGIGLRYNF
tara:strand:- start:806 stop:1423 length:618 start_codon:yes stop_codon:yes gene_type:complete